MFRIILATLLLLAPLSAGCIEAPQDDTADSTQSNDDVDRASTTSSPANTPDAPDARIEGMTATESIEDKVAACSSGGISIPPRGYCAERKLVVDGQIGLDELPVDLLSLNGDITVTSGRGDAWQLIALIKTSALTEDGAREALDTAWEWGYEDGDGYRLYARPTATSPPLLGGLDSARYEVTLPEWVVLQLTSDTTNGDLTIGSFTIERLTLSTTNGDITVGGRIDELVATTTNGDITAELAPNATGSYAMRTTNGDIELSVPETRSRGYDIDATTTNGKVTVELQDGKFSTDEKSRKHWTTNSYDARSIQTKVTLQSTNGGIDIERA